ncbi:MAG: hypothetical protein JWO66_1215 [Candidatus Eremiobacteraeota bacterium]|jgi:hypothetical protein|nr:hypothetical protein [Candidatus Eremiobacteraeota bacterium]
MIRAVFRSVVAIAVAVFAGRQAFFGARDLARYNAMRAMSGDPPLLSPQAKQSPTNSTARQTNPFVFLASIPSDIKRYLKLKSM